MIKWLTPVLALGVAIFIIFFLISINSDSIDLQSEPLVRKSEMVQKKSEQVWLNQFSKTQQLGYFYPVNEVYVQVDLEKKNPAKITTIYKLSASLLDPYQLFCLKEELKQHSLRYYLKRDKSNIELLIYSKNLKRLKSLVKVLKNYQISAKIRPYKKDA
jgi:hypothetical protein